MFEKFTEARQKELRGLVYSKFRSATEFARELGWSKQRLHNIMTAQTEPHISDVNAIAKGLNKSVGEITTIFLDE